MKVVRPGRVAALRRWWDAMGRVESDRAVYLALAELRRRDEEIDAGPSPHTEDGPLTPFELRVFSQNGEDGVLSEILRRIGAGERFFVEFGIESGREGNCVYLADVSGWRGLFIEPDADLFAELERKYRTDPGVQTVTARVTPSNVEELFSRAAVPAEPDVLSIDIDGQDYWVWEALSAYKPRVVVVEYNSALDPGRRLVEPPGGGHGWDGTAYTGASLDALCSLATAKGYRLVHTELAALNAFFVRADLAAGRFPDNDRVPRRASPNYFLGGYEHPPDRANRPYRDLDAGDVDGA